MAKFKCKICGFVTEEYDELPEDYKCPMCGASADMFEKVEQGGNQYGFCLQSMRICL